MIDYRPALRARTGVGEYIHQVASALARAGGDDITVFSSSWKDRPSDDLATALPNVKIVDQRLPVRVLNLTWHRLRWPPVEALTGGDYDIAHSPHPLLLPSRSAAQIVTIHDLHFLSHPERTSQEIRRDYPTLTASHARRADRIVVSSKFASTEVQRLLNVASDKISICPAGAPEWTTAPASVGPDGYILFMGTVEMRKNVGGLLQAYGRLIARDANAPRLVIAGRAVAETDELLEGIGSPPLAGRVDYLGYVPPRATRNPVQRRTIVRPAFIRRRLRPSSPRSDGRGRTGRGVQPRIAARGHRRRGPPDRPRQSRKPRLMPWHASSRTRHCEPPARGVASIVRGSLTGRKLRATFVGRTKTRCWGGVSGESKVQSRKSRVQSPSPGHQSLDAHRD